LETCRHFLNKAPADRKYAWEYEGITRSYEDQAALLVFEKQSNPCLNAELQKSRGGEPKTRFEVKMEGRKSKVLEYWHVAWMVEVETRIHGEMKRQQEKATMRAAKPIRETKECMGEPSRCSQSV
jgi:hypothetical protein